MTTNATIRTQFTFSVDDNTLGVILQRIQQVGNDGVPLAAYMQVKLDSSLNDVSSSLLVSRCSNNPNTCNFVKLVPGTTNTNTSNDSIYINRVDNFLTTLGIVYTQKQVVQILVPPQTLPGSPGAPSSIIDVLNCPPDGGISIEVFALYCGPLNTMIVEVDKKDLNRAFNILNAGQGNVCNRNATLIKNCNPFACCPQTIPGYIPFPCKSNEKKCKCKGKCYCGKRK